MAIKSYVPPKLKLIDHRSPEGGFYTANCDICGTEYYPKRSNSKYCSPKCGVVSHRLGNAIVLKNGGAVSKPKTQKTTGEIVKSADSVVWWFESRQRNKYGLKTKLKELEIGTGMVWDGTNILRETMSKYRIG